MKAFDKSTENIKFALIYFHKFLRQKKF